MGGAVAGRGGVPVRALRAVGLTLALLAAGALGAMLMAWVAWPLVRWGME